MKKKIALIFGVTGQDGAYLSKFLLKKKYKVYGVKRRSSIINTQRVDDIYKDINLKSDFVLYYGDLTDSSSIINLIKKNKPNEIYNLAAQSHVQVSFEVPEYSAEVNSLGTLRILEAIKNLNLEKKLNFIKLELRRCLVEQEKNSKMKKHLFIQPVHMVSRNVLHTGLQSTIERLIIFLHAMEFYLITKVQLEVRLLLQKNYSRINSHKIWLSKKIIFRKSIF